MNVFYTRRDFTLSYNVGEGKYISAVTAPYGTSVSLPQTATRAGYTFAGWYKDQACEQPASDEYNQFLLEENTTLYAKWDAAQSGYKIVYMIENANDNGYSYLATVTKTAPTGSSITMTEQTAGANGTRPSDLDTTNFTFKDSTTETVKADGTTTVVVRYSRNVYTITWNGEGYTRNGGRWHTGQGYASLTAKYGANISTEWTAKFNTPHPNWAWNFSNWNNNEKFTSLDIMPSGNKTVYNWYYTTDKTQILNYWFENYDSDTTKTYNGHTYGLFKAVTVHYNYLYNSDYPDYAGYTKGGWVRSDGAWYLETDTPWGTLTADFYYNAKQYPLTFYDYDGTLISTTQVTLNENIYNKIEEAIPSAPMKGATWQGWFTDAQHENAYTYSQNTKMPTGLVLYGNFQFPTRTITFNSQGGTAVAPETKEYGFYATKPTDPTREHYTFQGWYTAADETGSPYDWNKPVTEDTTLYAHWTQDTISYTVHYYVKDTTTKLANDKVVSDPAFTEGETITENAISIAGYVADEGSKKKELSFDKDENTITFYYEPIPSELSYTVNYVLKDHPNIKVAASKTVTVPGTTTNTMEMATEVDKAYLATQTDDADILGKHYRPSKTTEEIQLGLDGNVITFEYIPYTTSKITVNYLDMDGKKIEDSDISYVEKGDTFTVQNKAPDGYVYHHAYLDGTTTAPQPTYQITGDEGDLVINVYYQKKLIIIANNKSKTYDGTALSSNFANASDYTITGNTRGDTVTSIEFAGSQTDAGTSATTPKNAQITAGSASLTSPEQYYSIVYVPGSLTVKPASVYISVSADQWDTHSGSTGGPNYYTGQTFNVGFTNPNKQHFNDNSGSAYVSITSGQRALFKEKYGDAIWNALYGNNGALISEKDAGTYTFTGSRQRALLAGITVDGQAMMSDRNYSITLYARDSILKIEPLPLNITTPSDSKKYDGIPLTKSEGATLDHSYWTKNIGGAWTAAETAGPGEVTLGTGDKITFNVTGSQTEVDSSDNTYSIEWGTAKSSNYKITEDLGTLEVTGAKLKVTVKDIEKTYNGAEQEGRPFVANVTGTGETIETDDYIIEGLGKDDILTIGYTPAKEMTVGEYTGSFAESYTIEHNGKDVSSNYDTPSFKAGKLTITPATVTIKIKGETATKVYNGEEQKVEGFSYTATIGTGENQKSVKDEVTVTLKNGSKAEAKGTDVGNYPMGLKPADFTVTGNDNYTIEALTEGDITDGKLTITPATMTITANTLDKEFDGSPLYSTVTVQPDVDGTKIEYSVKGADGTWSEWTTKAPSITNVGTLTYKARATNSNYDPIESSEATLTIKPATVTVKANNSGKVYGGSDPKLTATVTGLKGGDSESVIKYTLSREPGENVGTYTITPSGAETQGNYTVKYETGTFTITKKEAFAITAVSYEGTYDGKAHAGGYTGDVPEGTEISYSTDGGKTWTSEAPSLTNVGSLTYIVRAENPNYEDVTAEGTITVNPKAITINADNKSKVYGTADPTWTATVTGAVSGELDKLISASNGQLRAMSVTPFKVKFSRQKGESVGKYKIYVTGDKEQGNYIITYIPGTLTITQPAAPDPTPTPDDGDNPGGGGNPANRGAGNPVAAAPATPATPAATPPAVITDNPTPTTVIDDPAPLANTGFWALINLICAIITAILCLIMLIRYFGKRREEDEETGEETEIKRKGLIRLLSLIPAIAAIIIFILTEDMTLPMQLVDKWTLLMVVILIIQIIVAFFAKKKKDEEEGDEANTEATA